MNDIYVLNGNLEQIGIVDTYKSCIWANRYSEIGDCELYVEATTEKLDLLVKGNYLVRYDDEMICQIKKVELDTDSENGNYLIVTGYDVKRFLDQRVIWGTYSVDGNVEDYLREIINKSLGNPTLSARQLKKDNNERLFYLGDKANFTEVTTEQNSYKNVGDLIRENCKKHNWGYKVVLSDKALYFKLYKGTDRSNSVIFSNEFENLETSKYVEDDSNLGNVALVAGEGEGSERSRNVSGYAEGINRYEIYVDAKDVSKTIKWSDLISMYPTTEQGGQGSIQKKTNSDGTFYYVYQMNYIDIQVVDKNQLTELKIAYPSGTEITVSGNLYYRVYNVAIADLPSNTLTDGDDVILRDLVYAVYLLNRGYEKLAEYGSTTSFEGSVEPNITFKYKEDYFLGDEVTVENEFGISTTARIVEVVEVNDDTGYRVEPKFEYVEDTIEPVPSQNGGLILTESSEAITTETGSRLLNEAVEELTILTASNSPVANSDDIPNIKISQLQDVEEINDGCCMPIVSNSETRKITYGYLKNKLANDLPQPTETDPVFSASAAADITDTDITNWNNKSNFSGSYNDLSDKPTIPTYTAGKGISIENDVISNAYGYQDLNLRLWTYCVNRATVNTLEELENALVPVFQKMMNEGALGGVKWGTNLFVLSDPNGNDSAFEKYIGTYVVTFIETGASSDGDFVTFTQLSTRDNFGSNLFNGDSESQLSLNYPSYISLVITTDESNKKIVDSVGLLSQDAKELNVLATDENYTTPYTPLYNGSPATKKYVDDEIVTAKAEVEGYFQGELDLKQDNLVSGTNIKTINNQSVLGQGNIDITLDETDPVFEASPAATITNDNINSWNNKSDFSGSYNDLTNKPDVPTKTSDLNNDSGFVTSDYHDSTKQDTLTAGTNISIDENNVISATGSSSNSTIGTIVASPASDNTNLGSFTAWGWQRVPLTRVVRQTNSSFALENNFLVNKSDKTINVLVSANGMFEITSSTTPTTYDLCVDYRTDTTVIGAISEAYGKYANAFSSVVLSPVLIAVEPGAKLSLSVRFSNAGTVKVNGGGTFITIQELEVPTFFGNDSAIIESGSNSNGDYIKYSDGTMICYKTVTGTVDITEQYYDYFYHNADDKYFNLGDYAKPFISRPICSITFRGGNSQWIGSIQNQSASHVGDLHIISVTSKTAGAYYDVIAFGRWK